MYDTGNCYTIFGNLFFGFYYNYLAITLDNIAFRIPKRMWNVDGENNYSSDHMFCVINKENKYLVYGSQLEKYDKDDEIYGLLNDYDEDAFLHYNDVDQLCTTISNCSDVLGSVTNVWKTEKPSYIQYCIFGEGKGKYKDYTSYIASWRNDKTSFIEVILCKDPESLTYKEKREIYKYVNYLYD